MSSNLPINKQIEKYIDEHSLKLHPVQDEIIKYNDTLGKKKKLQISINQCHFLYLVTKLFKPKEILEIGTFTGYSILSAALALPKNCKLIGIDKNLKTNNEAIFNASMDDNSASADIVDQASSYTEKNVEMRAINRQIKLISKIDGALKKIQDGTYGFCEETGEPIGLKRLMARPVATLSIEAQERHERDEKIFVVVGLTTTVLSFLSKLTPSGI